MTPLERTIWNLEKLAACPYCGENPCDHLCVMLKGSNDMTIRELEDHGSLVIARIALESAKKIEVSNTEKK